MPARCWRQSKVIDGATKDQEEYTIDGRSLKHTPVAYWSCGIGTSARWNKKSKPTGWPKAGDRRKVVTRFGGG